MGTGGLRFGPDGFAYRARASSQFPAGVVLDGVLHPRGTFLPCYCPSLSLGSILEGSFFVNFPVRPRTADFALLVGPRERHLKKNGSKNPTHKCNEILQPPRRSRSGIHRFQKWYARHHDDGRQRSITSGAHAALVRLRRKSSGGGGRAHPHRPPGQGGISGGAPPPPTGDYWRRWVDLLGGTHRLSDAIGNQ